MFIYLAHPIDFADHTAQFYKQMEQLRRALTVHGATAVYTPADAFHAKAPMHHVIQQINMYAMEKADCVVFAMPMGVHTLGVPFELGYTYAKQIPALIIRGDSTDESVKAREHSALLSMLDIPIYAFDQLETAAQKACFIAKLNSKGRS